MSDDINRDAFLEEAYELLAELETALLELEDEPEDMGLINRVFRALHTIKGSGAMFGFDEIAAFTHKVETVFDMVRCETLPVNKEILNLALAARDHLQEMLDSGKEDQDKGKEIVEALNLISRQVKEEEDEGDDPGPQQDGDESIVEPEPVPEREPVLYQIRVVSPEGSEHQDANLEFLFEEFRKLGECQVVAHYEDVPALEELDPVHSYVWWDVLLSTPMDKESLDDVALFSGEGLNVTVRLVEDSRILDAEKPMKMLGEILVERGDVTPDVLEDVLQRRRKIGEVLTDSGVVTKSQVDAALAEQATVKEMRTTRKQKEVASSIRVAADKLDYLVDLVGELVIVQAQISQVVGERSDPVMTTLAEELERLSDELRDSTLGIRMLPIGTTFSKFRRLVRDLSNELGKEIELTTHGAETELDKTVIERLNDPLVHLLRNSIDHGVESPEDRVAAGKKPHGTIFLSAEHSGGEVLIQIKDDGKGIDTGVIRAKAVEKGIITADAELSDKEIYGLIFHPGFSTAAKVTSVSGRGVGMDVVKRAIDSLRGSIDIVSEMGVGTTITVKLPLTLAIIDGLQVMVGDGYFVVPLSIVEECVELTRDDVEQANEQQIINLRGEIVPYIRLREWFLVDGSPPPIEQIVITGVEGKRIGIVVDNVIGEHQTVIKSLGRIYRDVEGISGATIKGDGSMALILDVPRLVRSVLQFKS